MREDRIDKIVDGMRNNKMDYMIISDPSTIFYLCGKFVEPGSRMLVMLINSSSNYRFFINALQTDYANISDYIDWYTDTDDPINLLAKEIKTGSKVGVDKNWPARFLISLIERVNAKFMLSANIIDHVRMIKDQGEIKAMMETCDINQKIMSQMFTYLEEGISELEHRKKLHELYCTYGADGYNITPIVAYGKSCGSAHHKSGDNTLKSGDCVMIDTGARLNGYRSDMTRTVFYKSCSDKLREIYSIVYEAQMTSMYAVKAGMRFCDIDKIGRDIITKAGYGEYFTHRIGHNIGIDGHEFPDVGCANEMEILPGMCFSVEPGIYIPGFGGVRIEDIVVVTDNGFTCMYDYTKELQIIN